MRTIEDLKHSAKNCVTHHEACDCIQLRHRQVIEQYRAEIEQLRLTVQARSEEGAVYKRAYEDSEQELTRLRDTIGRLKSIITELKEALDYYEAPLHDNDNLIDEVEEL